MKRWPNLTVRHRLPRLRGQHDGTGTGTGAGTCRYVRPTDGSGSMVGSSEFPVRLPVPVRRRFEPVAFCTQVVLLYKPPAAGAARARANRRVRVSAPTTRVRSRLVSQRGPGGTADGPGAASPQWSMAYNCVSCYSRNSYFALWACSCMLYLFPNLGMFY